MGWMEEFWTAWLQLSAVWEGRLTGAGNTPWRPEQLSAESMDWCLREGGAFEGHPGGWVLLQTANAACSCVTFVNLHLSTHTECTIPNAHKRTH